MWSPQRLTSPSPSFFPHPNLSTPTWGGPQARVAWDPLPPSPAQRRRCAKRMRPGGASVLMQASQPGDGPHWPPPCTTLPPFACASPPPLHAPPSGLLPQSLPRPGPDQERAQSPLYAQLQAGIIVRKGARAPWTACLLSFPPLPFPASLSACWRLSPGLRGLLPPSLHPPHSCLSKQGASGGCTPSQGCY